MNKATQIAQQILEEQGYCIMAFMPGPKPLPKVGDVIADPIDGGSPEVGKVPGPFFVIEESTFDEYVIQSQKYSPWRGGSLAHVKRRARRALGFFKVVAE